MDIPELAAALLLGIAFATDIRAHRIPNLLTVPACAIALIFHLAWQGWTGFAFSLFGMGFGFMALCMLYALNGIGAGDVKLFAALGAWVGLAAVWQILIYSILYAGATALILLLIWRKPLKNTRFPFMIAVLPAAVTGWLII